MSPIHAIMLCVLFRIYIIVDGHGNVGIAFHSPHSLSSESVSQSQLPSQLSQSLVDKRCHSPIRLDIKVHAPELVGEN